MGKKDRKGRQISSGDESDDKTSGMDGKGEYADILDDMDEEERKKFNQMSDKDREMEIFKRIEQREIMKTREQIKKKLDMAQKKGEDGEASGRKRSARTANLDQYRLSDSDDEESSLSSSEIDDDSGSGSDEDTKSTKRPDRSTSETGPSIKTRQKSSKKSEEDDDSDSDLDVGFHKPSEVANKQVKKKAMADLLSKRKNKKQAEERRKDAQKAALDINEIFGADDGKSLSSSSSSSSGSSTPTLSDRSRSPSPAVPKQEIKMRSELMQCRLSRHKLAKFVHSPFFNKLVVGCFVRIGIGAHEGKSVYRVAQIVDTVETAKVYQVEGTRTNKGIKLKHCADTRIYRLEFVSNQEFNDSEFLSWIRKMKELNLPLPTVDFVEKKKKEIDDALNYKYSEEEISKMVKEKARFKGGPTNFAIEKTKLLNERESAEQSGDMQKVNEIQQQIEELDAAAEKMNSQRTQQLNAVALINKRNRDLMKQAFLGDTTVSRDELTTSNDDPFTRKTAKMKMVSGSSKSKQAFDPNNAAIESTQPQASSSTSAADPLFQQSQIMEKKTPGLPKIGAEDLFNPHDIEIKINVQMKLPAPNNSTRNVASAEGSKGSHPSGSRKLTLEEYKRKRGMI